MADAFCRKQGFFILGQFCQNFLFENIRFRLYFGGRTIKMYSKVLHEIIYSPDNVAYYRVRCTLAARSCISKHNIAIFHGIIRPSKRPISQLLALHLKHTTLGEKRINFVAVVAREPLSISLPLSLLCRCWFYASSLPRQLHTVRALFGLTNEGNKLCRRPATSCIMKRDPFRAQARGITRRYVFISLVSCQNHAAYTRSKVRREKSSMLIA